MYLSKLGHGLDVFNLEHPQWSPSGESGRVIQQNTGTCSPRQEIDASHDARISLSPSHVSAAEISMPPQPDSGKNNSQQQPAFQFSNYHEYIIYNISWNNFPYSNYIQIYLIQLLGNFSLSETPSCSDTSMASIGSLHGVKQEQHGTTNYRLFYTKKKHEALQICQKVHEFMNLLQHSFEWTLEGFHKWGYP